MSTDFSWVGLSGTTHGVGVANFTWEVTTGGNPVFATCVEEQAAEQSVCSILYDNRLPNTAAAVAAAPMQAAAQTESLLGSPWGLSKPLLDGTRERWAKADPTEQVLDASWQRTGQQANESGARWRRGRTIDSTLRAVHQVTKQVDQVESARWQNGDQKHVTLSARHQAAMRVDRHTAAHHQVAQIVHVTLTAQHQVAAFATRHLVVPWQAAGPAPSGYSAPPIVIDPPTVAPRNGSTNLVFMCPPWASGPVNLIFGRVCGGDGPVQPGLIVVPVRGVYMTTNSVTLTRVDTGDVLTGAAFRMSVDVDSWTWSWSAVVSGSNQSLLNPDDPDPVEIAAVVNGVEYRLLMESVDRSRQFPSSRLNISGRGLAAELDGISKYFSSATALTAQQLAAEALTENGQSIGWSIDWGLTDWLVPANVWSYQGTRIGAVSEIASAAGGYLLPHKTARTLKFRHSYPFAPWDWAAQTPDIELPAAPVTIEGVKWHNRPDYNRVFVRGESEGVLGQITIAGTAGDNPAPMVVHPLITHVDAARQRGLSVLGDTGRQAMVSISLPVLAETGVIEPGNLIRYNDGSVNRLGLVRSTAVDWSLPKLRQQLEIETHV